MKRSMGIITIYIIVSFLLSGCSGGLFSSRRDMEHLLPVQTISLDRAAEGVELGVSSGIGPSGKAPLVMRCAASGIEPAIDRLQAYSPEDELFYAHVRYILLGESLADASILPLLDWVERSPSMRMDTAMLLVQGSAADALTGAAGEKTDITERLDALEREETARGRHIYSLREVASSLLERGSALCLAIRSEPSEGVIVSDDSESDAAIPIGYAVLRDGADALFLTEEETLGAELLEGPVSGARVTVDGNVLELQSDGARATGLWDESGALTGIFIQCTMTAGVIERREDSVGDMEALDRAFSDAAQGWLKAAVNRSQKTGCDYLDLHGAIIKNAPKHTDPDIFYEQFSSLPVTVYVSVDIDRSYDLSDRG